MSIRDMTMLGLMTAIALTFTLANFQFPSFLPISYGSITKIIAAIVLLNVFISGTIPPLHPQAKLYLTLFLVYLVCLAAGQFYKTGELDVGLLFARSKPFVFAALVYYMFCSPKRLNLLIGIYCLFATTSALIVVLDLNASFHAMFPVLPTDVGDGLEALYVTEHSHLETRKTFLALDQNIYANLLVVAVMGQMCLASLVRTRGLRLGLYATLPILLVALLETGSRTGYIQMLAMLVAWATFTLVLRRGQVFLGAFVGFFLLVGLSFASSAIPGLALAAERMTVVIEPLRDVLDGSLNLFDVRDVLASQVYGETLTGRIAVAIYSLGMFIDGEPIRWLFGYGSEMELISIGAGNHIGYIAWLIEYGFIFFFLVMLFLVLVFRRLRLQLRSLRASSASGSTEFKLVIFALVIWVGVLVRQLSSPAGDDWLRWCGVVLVVIELAQRRIELMERRNTERMQPAPTSLPNLREQSRVVA